MRLLPGVNPTAGGVALTGTVQPIIQDGTMPSSHPVGTVTFFDGTTALNSSGVPLVAGSASSAATFVQVFGSPDAALTGWAAIPSGIFGDFNGDGTPDLFVYNTNTTVSQTIQVQVFASIPGGKFVVLPLQTLTLPQGAVIPQSANVPSGGAPAVLDVNGDGHPDVLMGNVVLYGKGDGTFNSPSILPILATGFQNNGSVESYATDVNGDGKLDIVAVNTPPNPGAGSGTVQYAFTVFRNDGAGTFTFLGSFPLAASFSENAECCVDFNIFGLSFADFNGDGKVDVLSQSNFLPLWTRGEPNKLNVMLNNGDGTFGPVKAVDTAPSPSLGYDATAFADLNGDGKLDLRTGYSSSGGANYLGVQLGNGDGTFGSLYQLRIDSGLTAGILNPQLQLIDFNADGKLDVACGTGQMLLGNGDGTFTVTTPLFSIDPTKPRAGFTLLEMDIVPNSLSSLVFVNLASGANAVFTPADSSSATTTAVLAVGSHSLTAHYSGDSVYAATVSPAVTFDVAPAVTKTTITSSTNPSYAGQSVTFTAAIAGLAPSASGTVTFSNGSTTLGIAALSNGRASFATTFSSASNQIITAAYGGDSNDAASSGTVNQAVETPVTVGGGGGDSTSLAVAAGQSVTTQVSVKGVAGFGGTVNFSCTGLPMNAACSFAPASVTVSGAAAATTTLTVSTEAPMAMASVREGDSSRSLTVLACGLSLLGLLALVPVGRGGRLLLCLGFALLVSMSGLTGCGSPAGGAKTPAGSYSFNVVATSGSATSTATYKLTVQ